MEHERAADVPAWRRPGADQPAGGEIMIVNVNTRSYEVDVEPDTPLLWVLREIIGLTGTKFGCGIAQCGACTVHLDGEPVRSCSIPLSAVAGKRIVTIEGLSRDSSHPVQKAWVALDVPQCGYCQSGQIMAAVALLNKNPQPTDRDIDEAMTNICRCGTYQRVRAAIHMAAGTGKGGGSVIHMGAGPAGSGGSAGVVDHEAQA
jgi:isoquinoline 1-oxidoreductase alpha subunit